MIVLILFVHTLVSIFYQSWFATSYILSQIFGSSIGRGFMVLLMILFRFLPISPTPLDKPPRRAPQVTVEQCYPYYYLLRGALTKSFVVPKFPSCPVLFLFGACKRVMFHGPSFIKKCKDTQGCKYVNLMCGHWLQRQQPDVFLDEIKIFFEHH